MNWKQISRWPCLLALVLAMCTSISAVAIEDDSKEKTPPNILIILADDLGFSDLGCYGGEIETPNLDQIAKHGLRYNQFYNTGRCWPTRASIMSGYYPHQVYRDRLPGNNKGGAGGKRPAWAKLLPQRLPNHKAYHSGKWHIDGGPVANGFHQSFWMRDHGRFFHPRNTKLNDVDQPPVAPGTDYYVTSAIAEHAIYCLSEHAQQNSNQPFLSFVAFTAPHFPLHALPEDIAKYEGKYDQGWEAIRAERWQKQQALGLIRGKLSAPERKLGPPYDFPDHLKQLGPDEVNLPHVWSELTESQKVFQANKMEIHAAMVDRMDQEIGRIFQQLKAMDAWDNTLIFFLSDNGASAEIMVRSDGHDPNASPGSAATHLCLGPGWSTACNTPFRKHKTWVHEGGIATPLIVHWPEGIAHKNRIRQSPGHVIDFVPTILELSGQSVETDGPNFPGQSLVTTFTEDATDDRDEFFWHHDGHSGIRSDQFKLVRSKGGPWELYNLHKDRTETDDLAARQPERVNELSKQWEALVQQFKEQRDKKMP